jgi:hypothetical protein
MIAMAGKPKTRTLASAMPGDLAIDAGIDYGTVQPTWPKSGDNLTPDDIALPAPDASAFEPDAGLAADGGDTKWPDRPSPAEASAEPDHTIAKPVGRRHHEATGSNGHDRRRADRSHGHRRQHARAGADDHRSDVESRIKSVAALFSPAQPAH